ncbi:MAG: DUF3108 domain-containing protein [Phycisphaerae bacterium]|nr:DUF3108 domain-containing protein [Phycisphaerae bacterium]
MYRYPAMLASTFALLSVVGNLAAETPAVLLEKAIHAEESAGDVNEAIRLYQQIVDDAQAGRPYVAQAQFRLALCLQKVNRPAEAQAAFEKLISEFPEQADLIARARKLMPAPAFPDIVGCRLRETISLKLEPPKPGWKETTPSKSFAVYEYTILKIKWDLDPDLAKKTRSFEFHVGDLISGGTTGKSRSEDISGPKLRELTAGEYTIRLGAYDVEGSPLTRPDMDDMHLLAVATAKLTVKPLPKTQISINDIKPDGTIQFRFVSQFLNEGLRDLTTESFANSDFINVTSMSDDQGRPLKFTVKHDKKMFRYQVTLNEPVPMGHPVLMTNEGAAGTIQPVAGQTDEFRYYMKHWPATGEPTRRIEIYRLPKAAELLETTPKEMARRTQDGRIELFVEKMIPPGGSILTAFRYRLPGGTVASRPVTSTQPGIEPMKLKPATWSNGEVLRLRIRSEAGGEIGTISYSSEAIKAGTKEAWRIESYMVIPMVDMHQYTRVDAEQDTFAPIASRTYNSEMGDFRAEFGSNKVKLTTGTKEGGTSREIDLEGTAYDNEQAIYVIRRMPLAEGYRSTFPIFPVMGGSVMDVEIQVTAKEKVSVPAGAYECWKLTLAVTSGGTQVLQHTLWFSADPHQYLVKYQGDGVMELAQVMKREPTAPALFKNKELGISLTAPAGWSFYSNPSPRGYKMSTYLLSPEMKVWALLTVASHGSAFDSARVAAEGDIKTLKGLIKGYTVRADSWAEQKVAGLPAARYVADYQDDGKPMVESRVYILGESMVYWFVFRIEKDEFDGTKAELERIVNSFTTEQAGTGR